MLSCDLDIYSKQLYTLTQGFRNRFQNYKELTASFSEDSHQRVEAEEHWQSALFNQNMNGKNQGSGTCHQMHSQGETNYIISNM